MQSRGSGRTGSGGHGTPGPKRVLVKELPVETKQPEYGGRDVETGVGRRKLAKRVRPSKKEPPERSPQVEATKDLNAKGPKVVTKGRAVSADVLKDVRRSRVSSRTQLSASELEKRFARYEKVVEKLTPDESRAVEEYYRHLRDLK